MTRRLLRLPESLPEGAMYISLLISWALMGLLNVPFQKWVYPVDLRSPLLDAATYTIDPLLVHGGTAVLLAACFTGYQVKRFGTKSRGTMVATFLLWLVVIVVALVGLYLLEQVMFKPTFKFPRPHTGAELGNPWLTDIVDGLLKALVHVSPFTLTEYQDIPSGFAVRQLVLFYLAVWIALQEDFPGIKRLSGRSTAGTLIAVSLVGAGWVCFSRLYRHNHTLFSVSMAAGVATFFFWLGLVVTYALLSGRRSRYRRLLSQAVVAYVPFVIIYGYASNDVVRWVYFTVVLLVVLFVVLARSFQLSEARERW